MLSLRSHFLFAFAFVGIAAVCLLGDASAGGDKKKKAKKDPTPETINVFGKPNEFGKGKKAMYAIWFEDGWWHIRVTTKKGKDDIFNGTVKPNNGVIIGKWGDLEKPVKSETADYVVPHVGGRGFDFRFANIGGTDTVTFKAGPETTELIFDTWIEGGRFPDRVLIGIKGIHPNAVPFSLPAHPRK